MNRKPVTSSLIASIGYSAEEFLLEVEFNAGYIYQYYNVPHSVYNQLMSASSIGLAFNYLVRDANYVYDKI